MISDYFEITNYELQKLLIAHSNIGKNSHVGHIAVKVVKMFFLTKYPDATFKFGTKGADIEVSYDGKFESFEVKGTTDKTIAWQKLKVSSKDCHDALINGMILIRVTGVGTTKMNIHFLKCNEDFVLIPEVRYQVRRIKKGSS